MLLTVGIPVYNEEKHIGRLLTHLISNDFDFELKEITVVCSGCTDKSVNIVRKFMKKSNKIKIILEKKRLGKFSAVNKILTSAKGDYICFINADAVLGKNSLNVLARHLGNANVGMVTDRYVFVKKGNRNALVQDFQKIISDIHHEISLVSPRPGNVWMIKRGIVSRLPRKTINDDVFLESVISNEYKIKYDYSVKSMRFENIGLYHFVKQRQRILQGEIQLSKRGFRSKTSLNLIAKIILRKMFQEPQKFFHILLLCLVESYCYVTTLLDFKIGKEYYIWDKP